MSWRARKGLLPSSRTSASREVRSRPSRFTRSGTLWIMGRAFSTRSTARIDFGGTEEECNLLRRRLRRIRAMHHVALYAFGKIGANRAIGSLFGIRRAHDFAILRDGAIACEHLHHDRARGHVAHQIRVEGPLLVHGVKRARIALV